MILSNVKLLDSVNPAEASSACVSSRFSFRAIAKATAVCFEGLYVSGLHLIFEKVFLFIS